MLRMTEKELTGIGKRKTIKPPGNSEAEIQRAIKQLLQIRGWFVVKIHQSMGSHKGIADLYAIKDGRAIWIEVKTKIGKQSEHQEEFERDIVGHGGRYLVARSIEDVMRI